MSGSDASYGGRSMALFPPAFLEGLREKGDLSRWPDVLAGSEAVRARVEAAVAALPAEVAEAVGTRLRSERPGDPHFARALLWGALVARAAGCTAEAVVDESALRVRGAEPFLLLPLVFQMDRDARGGPDAVERLVQTLEGGFAGRRYALAVRRPIPYDFDADSVQRAVTLWVRAVERGDWRGRHAVYDDERLSIELTLLEAPPHETGHGLTFLVGPSVSLDRLSAVDSHLQDVVRRYADAGLPLVAVLVGEPRWGLSRGYATQLLLGTAREVRATSDGPERRWHAAYHPEGYSLFNDPQFKRLAALWWLEPASDPFAAVGWAHENPWRQGGEGVPSFPGLRCGRVEETDEKPRPGRVWMGWIGQGPTPFGGP